MTLIQTNILAIMNNDTGSTGMMVLDAIGFLFNKDNKLVVFDKYFGR